MPTTPPLIMPTNLPGNWMARSKINKKPKPNIFSSQNKQVSFDTNDDLQFLSSPPFNDFSSIAGPSSPTEQKQQEELATSTKQHHVSSFEGRTLGVLGANSEEINSNKQREPPQYSTRRTSSQPTQSDHCGSQQQQPKSSEDLQHQNSEQFSSQSIPAPTNMVIDDAFQETDNCQKNERINIEEESERSMEQFESLSFGKYL